MGWETMGWETPGRETMGRETKKNSECSGVDFLHPASVRRLTPCRETALEADLQDLTSVAHKPSSFRIRKSDRPVAAHRGQAEPGSSFVGSPGR
jgi:hypothetical protein